MITMRLVISIMFLVMVLTFLFSSLETYAIEGNGLNVDLAYNKDREQSVYPMILINTTSISNCLPKNNDNSPNTATPINQTNIRNTNGSKNLASSSGGTFSDNNFCKFYGISDTVGCIKYFTNRSTLPCKETSLDSNDKKLGVSNFSNKGYLFADTKFKNQYTFESTDPINPANKIRISLDFDKHTQGDLDNLNSPRIELVRENQDGDVDMSAAKNQTIKWQGNIKEYFESPEDEFSNEIYITIQFNTGSHKSDEDDQRNGFGVLFDVSGDSNPNLFEF